jgi:AraC-like DNA-binding protein
MELPDASYVELVPRPDLRAHLACAWIERTRPDGQPFRDHALPDAWVDVVWGRRLWVRGPDTRRHSVSYGAGCAFVGVRLQRGAAPAVLGVSSLELVDRRVPIGALWGCAGAELEEQLAETPDPRAAAAALQGAVARRIALGRPPDEVVGAAAAGLERSPRLGVAELSGMLGLSERHLRRRCREALGYGPKTLARVLRLQRLRRLAVGDPGAALTDLALRAGYVDQAHMNRDCRQLAAETPSRLVSRLRVRFVQDSGLVEP